MAMNIKNREAHDLAQKVAALTGLTLTDAVTVALREKLERLVPDQRAAREERLARARSIVEEMRSRIGDLPPMDELDDLLYDPETGLPR